MIEVALGQYPYPPETYQNVFAQLTAIVNGPPPELPPGYSEAAIDFVARCLVKEPRGRASYAELLVSKINWIVFGIQKLMLRLSGTSFPGRGSYKGSRYGWVGGDCHCISRCAEGIRLIHGKRKPWWWSLTGSVIFRTGSFP